MTVLPRHFFLRFLWAVWLAAGLAVAADLGPLGTRSATVHEPGERHEALGPLLSGEVHGSQQWWALSPLVVDLEDPEIGRRHFDLLYPLLTYDRFETESRWQLLQLLNFATSQPMGDGTNSDTKIRRNLFPFVFSQKSPSGTNDYLAVVPFYGRMNNHLFRDRIEFVALPLWVVTEKRGVETINVPAPFFHLRRGAGVAGWQLWPLFGHETKAITWKTNLLDEPVLIPGHEKSFLGWPFGFANQFGLGTTNPATERMLLPLFSVTRSPARDNTTVLWPFFTHTEDREKGFTEWGAPWPFLMWANGPGKTARRVWPLFGTEQTPTRAREFIGWPFYKHRRVSKPALVSDRWQSVFFLYDQSRDVSVATGARNERRDLWPLFYWKRDFEGRERFQAIALLETLLKNNEAAERTYSPLWSVYRSERNPNRGMASQSLLWNLWRRDTTTNAVTTSGLFGAIRSRSDQSGRQWRFFWRPFEPATPPSPRPVARIAAATRQRGDFLRDLLPASNRPAVATATVED
jgi:hypothetical protein